MEAYFDKEGKLLPKFYQDPKWKVMGSILVTVFDCTWWIATWGFAINLVILKSIFIIAYSLVFPSAGKVDRSKENAEKDARISRDSSTGNRPIESSSLESRQKSRVSTSESKARPVASKSEKPTKTISPELERAIEAEKVRQLSEVRSEGSSNANEFKDPEESP